MLNTACMINSQMSSLSPSRLQDNLFTRKLNSGVSMGVTDTLVSGDTRNIIHQYDISNMNDPAARVEAGSDNS